MEVLDAADGGRSDPQGRQHPFDLVISDLSMPQADGFAVLACGAQEAAAHAGHHPDRCGGVPDSVRAMREGAFDFLTKPFHPTALTEVVRAALTQAGVLGQSPG
jgi:DNA-binding NtrC family response regulator